MNPIAALRRIAEEEAGSPAPRRCGCARCRAREEAAALRATRAGTGRQTLPAWRGWTPAASLRDILTARQAARRGAPVDPRLRPFVTPGAPALYRITRGGIDRGRPLTIGMTERRPVADRLQEHLSQPSRADPKVHRAIRNLDPGQIFVQAGRLAGRPSTRTAHLYELWLQHRERPLVTNPDTRSFDEIAAI